MSSFVTVVVFFPVYATVPGERFFALLGCILVVCGFFLLLAAIKIDYFLKVGKSINIIPLYDAAEVLYPHRIT